MALYQVVLERDGPPDEIRLHDRPLHVGATFLVFGHTWEVHTVERDPVTGANGATVEERYLCRAAS